MFKLGSKALVLAPVNNDVINNDVAPLQQRR